MDRLADINKGLPLIPKDMSLEKQLQMAKKKLEFMNNNSALFISTGEYMMTLASVEREIESLNDVLSESSEVKE